MKASHFAYATVSPASLTNHKREVALRHPDFRFAFSRPGLVTWKSSEPLPLDFRLTAAIAQTTGVSLGSYRTVDELHAALSAFGEVRPVLVHARPRLETTPELDERVTDLTDALGQRGVALANGADSSSFFDVIVPDDENEPYFLGARAALPGDPKRPSDFHRHTPPVHSPSRAYAKLSEALVRFPNYLLADELALELGAAPGGAVVRLIEEGLHVVAVDPAEMDAAVFSLAVERGRRLTHVHKPGGEVRRDELPPGIHWILSDMNLAPPVVLSLVERFRAMIGPGIRGAFVTIKLNDERAVAALPRVEIALKKAFPGTMRALQLPSHRTEVLIALLPRATVSNFP